MIWYNPLNWFKKDLKLSKSERTSENTGINIICDNFSCKDLIIGSNKDVVLDLSRKRIYCDSQCAISSGMKESLSLGRIVKDRFCYIDKDMARRLYEHGKLEQSRERKRL